MTWIKTIVDTFGVRPSIGKNTYVENVSQDGNATITVASFDITDGDYSNSNNSVYDENKVKVELTEYSYQEYIGSVTVSSPSGLSVSLWRDIETSFGVTVKTPDGDELNQFLCPSIVNSLFPETVNENPLSDSVKNFIKAYRNGEPITDLIDEMEQKL